MKIGLKFKLLLMFFLFISIPMTLLGLISYHMSAEALQQDVDQELTQTTGQTAQRIEAELDSVMKSLQIASLSTALINPLANGNFSTVDAAVFLTSIKKTNGDAVEMVMLVDATGKVLTSTGAGASNANLGDQDYFQKALKGIPAVSQISVSEDTGKHVLMISTPVRDSEHVVGVLIAGIDFNRMTQYAAQIKVGNSGYAYMLDRDGLLIYHPVAEKILKENLSDNKNADFKALVGKMKGGKSGKGFATYDGVYKYVVFQPVRNWVLAVTVNYSDYMSTARSIRTSTILLTVISILVALALAYLMSSFSIINPIRKLRSLMEQAGHGDLTVRSRLKNRDELGDLGISFNYMIQQQSEIVRKVRGGSLELAAASEETAASASQINTSSQQISENVSDVAGGAQQQSSSIMDVSRVLSQLSERVQLAQSKAASTGENADFALETARRGRDSVDSTVRAMDTINESTRETADVLNLLNELSGRVGGIITTINSIAGQTNLLALNAAIEAARAGEHGKSFSVVADQIRKLSEESNNEAKSISDLVREMVAEIEKAVASIEDGRNAVENGVRVVNETDETFIGIINAVEQIVANIGEITAITDDEVAHSHEMTGLIGTIAQTTQTTSANAQEVLAEVEEQTSTIESISAGAEQISAMAGNLDQLVKAFKIHINDDNISQEPIEPEAVNQEPAGQE